MKTNIYSSKMKKLITLLIGCFIANGVYAQQDAMFTHYAFNTLAVNPAYAGSRDALTVTALHRSQWVGFDGAPTTQTLTLHTPFANDRMGVGLSVLNDKIGPLKSTSFAADFAARIPITEKGRLAFGIKGMLNMVQGGLTDLQLDQNNDNAFSTNIQNEVLPNFGVGLYYYTTKWYAGVSVPKLIENELLTIQGVVNPSGGGESRHYFFIAGTVFNLTKNLKFRPTTLVKVTEAAPAEADVTGMFVIQDKIELGAMYRTLDAAGLLLGYNINPQFRIGYSFDWSFTNTTFKYNSGSHEIMLRYDFIYGDQGKIRSPRYF